MKRLPTLDRFYYEDDISVFHTRSDDEILGCLVRNHPFSLEIEATSAWREQIQILRDHLKGIEGHLFFEFAIPRMAKRADVVLLLPNSVLVIEFKVGETSFLADAVNQVWDYALDLKNFHEPSHTLSVIPILVATKATSTDAVVVFDHDRVSRPLCIGASQLASTVRKLISIDGKSIDLSEWKNGRYKPTPTIVEAATALYGNHNVSDISRSEGGSENLSVTSRVIDQIIIRSRENNEKSLVLVTGVPGAGKTLVGLDVATRHSDIASELYSVFLSGNGPLVAVLTEALARDKVHQENAKGLKSRIGQARSTVKQFVQIVHEFRDESLRDSRPPVEHVALFDEAQRAWNLDQTRDFMKRKKGIAEFNISEPQFLISCLDRHQDWAVVVGLVGGGQEINTGEAGIAEWLESLIRAFPSWKVYISDQLSDSEYGLPGRIDKLCSNLVTERLPGLHLSVSMRSFRSENVSRFVKELLDLDESAAKQTLREFRSMYPIFITRDITAAKRWLRSTARGTERTGIVVSSQAERLKPHAIHVKAPMDPVKWFLNDRSDVRSSYYLEDVATEFHIQGLEIDWGCVVWDGDFRRGASGWENWSFVGDRWQRIHKEQRQTYQKNAYRVLLTRSRQGMVICVPEGDPDDPTRSPNFYDPTYEYLRGLGLPSLS